MLNEKTELDVPINERLLVYPKQRQQLFLNLVENYKIFCPNLKMIYAALNFDSELKIDYLVIFEGYRKGKRFVIWDSPFLYTNRAIPSYRYAVKNNLYKEYFDTCVSHFCNIEYQKFIEFLNSDLCSNLSTDSNSKKYWKSPDNSNLLMKGMSELGLIYVPEGFINTGRRKVD